MLIFVGVHSHAAGNCKRSYSLGVAEDQLKRKSSINGKSALPGMATELLDEIKKRVNCVFDEVPLSPEKALVELQNYRLDIFAFSFTNESFRKVADEQIIYSTSRILLVDRKFYKPAWNVQDYLKSSKIKFGALSISNYWYSPDELRMLAAESRIAYSSKIEMNGHMLAKGKVQAIFTSPAFLHRMIEAKDILKTSVAIRDPAFRLTVALMLSKKRVSPEERDQFAKAIEGMRTDGSIEKILLHYVPAEDLKTYYKF